MLSQFKNFEFRSKEEISDWPLVRFNLGANPETRRPKVAKGVAAIGNIAYGLVSVGAMGFGLVTLAAFGPDLVSLGGSESVQTFTSQCGR